MGTYKVLTKFEGKRFEQSFKTVKGVDDYLKKAMRFKRISNTNITPEFFVNGTRVTKRY